jgi:asparagine synthetase B (glutamine-hydrolysing)
VRPLANVLALLEPDPELRAARARRMRADYPELVEHGDWLLARKQIAGTPAPTARSSIAVAEGCAGQTAAEPTGDDTFVRAERQRATVVRAAAGAVPVYLWADGARAIVATRLGDLVRQLPFEPRIDALALAALATGHTVFVDRRTPIEGVRLLGAGESAVLHGEWRIRRYWDPADRTPARPTRATLADHAARLRAGLCRNLEAGLSESGRNLLTLSGGVDSSSLAALTARVIQRSFSTLTFVSDDPRAREWDLGFVRPLLAACAPHVTASHQRTLGVEHRLALLTRAPRELAVVFHPALCVLPELAREHGVQVLFGGEFADALLGSAFTIDDWSRNLSARLLGSPATALALFEHRRAWARHTLSRAMRRPLLPYASELAPFMRSELREEYAVWFRAQQRRIVEDRRPRALLAERRLVFESPIAMNWEVASGLGVARLFPFLSRELVELAFECHPTEALGILPKRVLRAALGADVPRANLRRRDKGRASFRAAADLPWSEPVPEELAGIVRDDWLPRPPARLRAFDALRLRALLNIVDALRTRRGVRQPGPR